MFGHFQKRKQQLEREFNELDIIYDNGGLGEDDIKRRLQLQEDFWRCAKYNESLLHQKSRDTWIKERDCNT